MAKITPSFWFAEQAGEAAAFYVSIFPDSEVVRSTALPAASPSGPAGSVQVVDFKLAGQPFLAMSAPQIAAFNHAVSFTVNCADQAEVDHYWDALSQGGEVQQCGWLKDRFGVFWQIVPVALGQMMADPDREKAGRMSQAMLKMVKLDIAGLKKAFEGE